MSSASIQKAEMSLKTRLPCVKSAVIRRDRYRSQEPCWGGLLLFLGSEVDAFMKNSGVKGGLEGGVKGCHSGRVVNPPYMDG